MLSPVIANAWSIGVDLSLYRTGIVNVGIVKNVIVVQDPEIIVPTKTIISFGRDTCIGFQKDRVAGYFREHLTPAHSRNIIEGAHQVWQLEQTSMCRLWAEMYPRLVYEERLDVEFYMPNTIRAAVLGNSRAGKQENLEGVHEQTDYTGDDTDISDAISCGLYGLFLSCGVQKGYELLAETISDEIAMKAYDTAVSNFKNDMDAIRKGRPYDKRNFRYEGQQLRLPSGD